MGNKTNPKNWDANERLLHIERLAYWRGWIRRARQPGVEKFGVSVPQASADISAYIRINPKALSYNLSEKRYVAGASMATKLKAAQPEDGFALLGGLFTAERVARIDLPVRHVPHEISRRLLGAAFAGDAIEVHYFSINSGTAAWRWIAPHSFGNDGYRWHARAWCFENATFKDFVLGRIAGVRASRSASDVPRDRDWEEWTTVSFRAKRGLGAIQRKAVEMDFGMKAGVARLKVRKAMLHYVQVYLGLHNQSGSAGKLVEQV